MDAVEFLAKRLRELDNELFRRVGYLQTPLQRPWGELPSSDRAVWIEHVRTALKDLRESAGSRWSIDPSGELREEE